MPNTKFDGERVLTSLALALSNLQEMELAEGKPVEIDLTGKASFAQDVRDNQIFEIPCPPGKERLQMLLVGESMGANDWELEVFLEYRSAATGEWAAFGAGMGLGGTANTKAFSFWSGLFNFPNARLRVNPLSNPNPLLTYSITAQFS